MPAEPRPESLAERIARLAGGWDDAPRCPEHGPMYLAVTGCEIDCICRPSEFRCPSGLDGPPCGYAVRITASQHRRIQELLARGDPQ